MTYIQKLVIAFTLLKFFAIPDLPWWWVLSPLWLNGLYVLLANVVLIMGSYITFKTVKGDRV